MLEPTELGKILGISTRKLNETLKDLGFQYKEGDSWKPTEEILQYTASHYWKNGTKTGYNLKWNKDFIVRIIKRLPNKI